MPSPARYVVLAASAEVAAHATITAAKHDARERHYAAGYAAALTVVDRKTGAVLATHAVITLPCARCSRPVAYGTSCCDRCARYEAAMHAAMASGLPLAAQVAR